METTQKNTKKVIFSVVALAAVMVVLLGVYFLTKPKAVEGSKTVTIQVVHKDQSTKTFEVTTTQEYLGEMLKEEELVEGEDGPYGLYIKTVDQETVDESNQEWWCLTKGGEQVNTSADQTPVMDGEQYELTLTVGY